MIKKIKDYIDKIFNSRNTEKNNPYLSHKGMLAYNNRFQNLESAKQQWQAATFVAMTITMLLGILLFKTIGQSRVEPFVVETNQGQPYAVLTGSPDNLQDPRLINYAVNQFIINARTVTQDESAQKSYLDNAYAYSADNTLSFLRAYYDANNPFVESKQKTVSVNIIATMPISANTWQVTWDETTQNIDAATPPTTTRYLANLQIRFGQVNPHFITNNPFGLYVTQISWSPMQTHAV